MTGQRDLPVGDRDETVEPRRGEALSEFMERAAEEIRPAAAPSGCGCRERGWTEQHGPTAEERIDSIFSRRAPGQEG